MALLKPSLSKKDEEDEDIVSTTQDLQTELDASLISKKIWGATRPKQNFFLKAELVKADLNAPKPYRVFSDPSGTCAAMRVTRDPDLKTLSVEEAAVKFSLPGLPGALNDYLERFLNGTRTFLVGGSRSKNAASLPFSKLKIWSKMRLQHRQYHDLASLHDVRTIFAMPPDLQSEESQWRLGRNDFALININPDKIWPHSSLEGKLQSFGLLSAVCADKHFRACSCIG